MGWVLPEAAAVQPPPEEVAVVVGLTGVGAAVGDEARVKSLHDEPGASWVGRGPAVEVPNSCTCTSLQP